MKTVKTAITVCAFLLFALTAFAQQDATTQEKLAEIESKVSDIKSYNVSMKVEMEMMGQKVISESQISFKRPEKVRMTTKTRGMTDEIYSTGDLMWTYMPAQQKAVKVNLRRVKFVRNDKGAMGGQANITDPFKDLPKDAVKYIEAKETDEGKVYIFEATPDLGGQSPQGASGRQMLPEKIIVWINSETGLPTKTTTIGKNGDTMMEQTYSDFQINPVIDDSEFEFTPPKGVRVVDMTLDTMRR
jgi:outer membrane lipoprotein-sorting protein